MAEEHSRRPDIDKSRWGPGPWQTEPDRVEFVHAGLPCLALRNHYGAWCGYAAVPPGHPLHGQDYNDVDVEAHGGLTYASLCADGICHEPAPGEPADVWWFGFDCGHAWDLMPGMRMAITADCAYRTLDYVRAEIRSLAEQLVARATALPASDSAADRRSEHPE